MDREMAGRGDALSVRLRAGRLPVSATRREWLVLAAILALGLLVRLPLVYTLGPTGDVDTFVRWARLIHEHGLTRIYDGTGGVDYGPLSMYLFAGAAFVETHLPGALRGDSALITLIKLPAILADVLTAALLASAIARRTRSLALPIAVCGLYLFNPAIWYVSAYWGQTDSIYTLFLVAAVLALERGAVTPAWVAYAAVMTLKIVAVSIAPLLVVWTLAMYGWRRLAAGLAAFAAASAAILLPWLVTGRIAEVAHRAYLDLPTEAPKVDVSAYNGWYLALGGRVHELSSKAHPLGLSFTYQRAGITLFGIFAIVVIALALRRRAGVIVPAATLALGMFMLLTQMHERYLFPVLSLVLLAAATRSDPAHKTLWWVYGVLSVTFLFNLVTIASFAPGLLTNLVVASGDSPHVVVLKGVALAVAAVNLLVLGWLVLTTVARRPDRGCA